MIIRPLTIMAPRPAPPEPPGPSFDEVTIGSQTWMAKNLSIDDGGEGIYIFDNVTANDVNFGTIYYYTQEAANRIAGNIEGWHLPTIAELNSLQSYIGGSSSNANSLGSISGWQYHNGTNETGLNLIPVGVYELIRPQTTNLGTASYLLSSNSDNGYYLCDGRRIEFLYFRSESTKSRASTVRLIKDVT